MQKNYGKRDETGSPMWMSYIVTVSIPYRFIEQKHARLKTKNTLLLNILFEGIRKAQARIATTFVGRYDSGFI